MKSTDLLASLAKSLEALPKLAPEKLPNPNWKVISQPSFFRGYVKLRGEILVVSLNKLVWFVVFPPRSSRLVSPLNPPGVAEDSVEPEKIKLENIMVHFSVFFFGWFLNFTIYLYILFVV